MNADKNEYFTTFELSCISSITRQGINFEIIHIENIHPLTRQGINFKIIDMENIHPLTRQGINFEIIDMENIHPFTRQGINFEIIDMENIHPLTRQGLKPLANSLSPLKRTENIHPLTRQRINFEIIHPVLFRGLSLKMRKFISGRVGNMSRNTASLFLLIAFYLFFSSPGIAATNNQNPNPNEFAPNPLEIRSTDDPLLPRTDRRRILTSSERATLSTALDQLNASAAAKFQAGDRVGAFEIWYRELRLRRYIGPLSEVQALGRVGAIAWQQNTRSDVQIITKRLQTIQLEAQKKPQGDLELLRSLGSAYQQVNAPQLAVGVYEQILASARQQQDVATQETILLTLADLNISYFEYTKAADNYRELLRLAEEKSDRIKQVAYLKQLAYIYDQTKQYQLAIKTKQQLIDNQQDLLQIPALKLSIGDNYATLGLLEQAAQNYQEAYTFAFQQEMYSSAGSALQKLANLFQNSNQMQQALEVYQNLLSVNALAKDAYATMNAYDQIGKIYLTLKDYPQALNAFQQGLQIAKGLQYREAYFAQQIEQVTKRSQQ